MNPTDKESWQAKPRARNAHDALVPLSARSPRLAVVLTVLIPLLAGSSPGPAQQTGQALAHMSFFGTSEPIGHGGQLGGSALLTIGLAIISANFVGADRAAVRLAELEAWRTAGVVKANPDLYPGAGENNVSWNHLDLEHKRWFNP